MGTDRTEVEHSKQNPRVDGSSLATDTDTRREKRAKIGGCHYLSIQYKF